MASLSFLERLPNELLMDILHKAMTHDTVFYLEYHDADDKNTDGVPTVDPVLLPRVTLFYPHSGKRGVSKIPPLGSPRLTRFAVAQAVHYIDWLMINTTNRRIRTIGKICFFEAKQIAMTYTLPSQLHHGLLSHLLSADDQALALRHIRRVALVDIVLSSPSAYVSLPRILSYFTNLKRVSLLVNFSHRFRQDEFSYIANRARDVPAGLRRRLFDLGMPPHLDLRAGFASNITEALFWDNLLHNVYPMLDFISAAKRRRQSSGTARD